MIEVAPAVEIDEGLKGNLGRNVRARLGFHELFGKGIVGGYVSLVMVFVVELHYLAGNGGFEGGIVVYGGG